MADAPRTASVRVVMVKGSDPWTIDLGPYERIVGADHQGVHAWVYVAYDTEPRQAFGG